MKRTALIALAFALVATSACKHQEDAAKQKGAELAMRNLQQPIDRASAAAAAVEKNAPVLLDPTTNVYHKTTCRNADAGSMEATTMGLAESRGAKPDPVCFPGR